MSLQVVETAFMFHKLYPRAYRNTCPCGAGKQLRCFTRYLCGTAPAFYRTFFESYEKNFVCSEILKGYIFYL